jgi:hypothetical protein
MLPFLHFLRQSPRDIKDLERYPQDRRTIRWRGEYIVVFVVIGILSPRTSSLTSTSGSTH